MKIKTTTLINDELFIENDPDSDYWLGFLAADGSIDNNRIRVEISIKDKIHIINFCKFFKGIILKERYKKEFDKQLVYASINSKKMVNHLFDLGITENKSLTLNYKGNINWNFIRGVFDGDGSISLIKGQNRGRVIFYSASLLFITQIKDFLNSQGFNVTIKNYDKRTKNPFYSLWICKQSSIIKLYDLMYAEEGYFLERKKEKFKIIKENKICSY